jgi:hypothetical protein
MVCRKKERRVCYSKNNKKRSQLLLTDGAMVRILTYCARGRKFDLRTVQIFVRMNMSVCHVLLCIVFISKKVVDKYLYLSII